MSKKRGLKTISNEVLGQISGDGVCEKGNDDSYWVADRFPRAQQGPWMLHSDCVDAVRRVYPKAK